MGLFAYLGAGGAIRNVSLQNMVLRASGGYDVGGVAGRNLGTIRVIAHVPDCVSDGQGRRGALQGEAYGVEGADGAPSAGLDDASQVGVEFAPHSLRKPLVIFR